MFYTLLRTTVVEVAAMLVGVCGANTPEWTEAEHARFARGRFRVLKAMSYYSLDTYRRCRAACPGLRLLVRPGEDGVPPPPAAYVERYGPEIEALLDLGFAPLWWETWNEPNHAAGLGGFGPSDAGAAAFAEWHLDVTARLRARFPALRPGFPGLAPCYPHRDLEWLAVCRAAVEGSDWLGAHVYWQAGHRDDPEWGRRHERYHALFPRLPVHVTEFGKATPGVTKAELAAEYPAWLRRADECGWVRSASAFILGGTADWETPNEWHGAFWITDEVAQAMAEVAGMAEGDYGAAEFVGAACYEERAERAVDRVVIHSAEGTLEGMRAWFANPKSSVSAHYGVGRGGRVLQFVRERDVAWHAGAKPEERTGFWGDGNENERTVGIELEGRAGDEFCSWPAQWAALVALCRYLVGKYGITLDERHIVPHSRLSRLRSDPGAGFDWARFYKEVGGGCEMDAETRYRLLWAPWPYQAGFGIPAAWAAEHAAGRSLGRPCGPEGRDPDGVTRQHFALGTVEWREGAGATVVR